MACRGSCAIKPTKPNQTKLENILSFPKNLTFLLKSDQINLFNNRIKNYHKNPCPKIHIEDKTNLTFLGIKWPTEFDMPLNKTQTQYIFKWELTCLHTSTAIFSTQLNGFNYCYLTLIILFNINHLFVHSEEIISIVI